MICIKKTLNAEQLYFNYEVDGSVIVCVVKQGIKEILFSSCYLPHTNSKYHYDLELLGKFSKTWSGAPFKACR